MRSWCRACCRSRSAATCSAARCRCLRLCDESNYNSIGKAPQVWSEPDGTLELISRRETIEDILRAETNERLAL